MNQKEQEWTERYIYQVVRRLPRQQRKEVEEQLRELIGDMAEAEGGVQRALEKLGDPAEFAKKYQDGERFLIGPESYDSFLWFVKVVLLCTAIPLLCVNALEGVKTGAGLIGEGRVSAAVLSAIYGITGAVPEILSACLSAFGSITLMFAILEKKRIRLDRKSEREGLEWNPNCLEPIPPKKARIDRADSIVGIVFILLFGVLLIFAPEFFSAFVRDGEGIAIVPVFHLEEWNRILPFFVLSLAAGLFDEVFRLAVGRYCLSVLICNIICNAMQLVFGYVTLFVLPLWNPDFALRLEVLLHGTEAQRFPGWWNPEAVSSGLFCLFVAITLLEIGTTAYRTFRYGRS